LVLLLLLPAAPALAPTTDPISALFAAIAVHKQEEEEQEPPVVLLPFTEADDEDQHAALPWDSELADSDDEIFHDAGTWSEDEEEVTEEVTPATVLPSARI
jgi:hypothetical protein